MHLKFRNVNDAFQHLIRGIHTGEIVTDTQASRYGQVLRIEEPVIITYERPMERVLFNTVRDQNCFFTLFESLWMLAGRRDVAPIAYYNPRMFEFSDDKANQNDAYGYRWREFFGWDQLQAIIQELKSNPRSRRVVLQMWDPGCAGESCECGHLYDLFLATHGSKSVPCNLCVLFDVEFGPCPNCTGPNKEKFRDPVVGLGCSKCRGEPSEAPRYLNMTVFNRSNDMILGALGANYVHFGFLQEFIACCVGLKVGCYHQVTNNLHVYTEGWKPKEWLAEYLIGPVCKDCCSKPKYCLGPPDKCVVCSRDTEATSYNRNPEQAEYANDIEDQTVNGGVLLCSIPLVQDPEAFNRQVKSFIDNPFQAWTEPFLACVAAPMCEAFRYHKERDYNHALAAVARIMAEDWRLAAWNWITKRQKNWERKNERELTQGPIAVD